MTSEEIKQKSAIDLSTNSWLREITLQLALLNEKGTPAEFSRVLQAEVRKPKGGKVA